MGIAFHVWTKATDRHAGSPAVCVRYGLLWLKCHNQLYVLVCVCEKTICVFFLIHFVYTFVIFSLVFFFCRCYDLFTSTVVSFDSHSAENKEDEKTISQLVSVCNGIIHNKHNWRRHTRIFHLLESAKEEIWHVNLSERDANTVVASLLLYFLNRNKLKSGLKLIESNWLCVQ